MIEKQTTIINKLGLHARASAKLTKLAGSFPCEVWMQRGERRVNAKSIMGVMMLAAGMGTAVTLQTSGEREQEAINRMYPECENISVDYAIMEKAEEIFVCPADFGWSDLGTWGALLMQTKHDLYGNSIIGNNVSVYDTQNCIIHTTEEKKVVVQGLDGYIVAEKDDTLLICKLAEEQKIRSFAEED